MTDYKVTLLHKKIAELSDLSESGFKKLYEAATLRHLSRGEMILKEGQVCKTIVFVEKGYLRTFVNKEGLDVNTDFVFENNFTTNLKSLRSSMPSDTNIQAGEASTIFQFSKDGLLDLYKTSPEIESFGRKLLEQLLIAHEEHSNLFKLYTPTERYHYLITHKPQMIERISLSQIASYLGIARETLSRIRKKR